MYTFKRTDIALALCLGALAVVVSVRECRSQQTGTIVDIGVEYMMDAPGLWENFTGYKQCVLAPPCNPAPFLEQRDALIKSNWPQVFNRISNYDAWNTEHYEAEEQRGHLFFAQRLMGTENMKQHCLPVIGYHQFADGDKITVGYSFEGFTCS